MPTFSKRFLFVGLCWLTTTAAFAQQYTVTDLGTLGGSIASASDINAAGQIVGGSTVQDGSFHPFLWENGVLRDLGLLPGFTECRATAINDAVDIVGSCGPGANGIVSGFIWSPSQGFRSLGRDRSPNEINNHGDVVGGTSGAGNTHAWVIRNGIYTDLGEGNAYGINDAGQIVGVGPGVQRAVMWDESGIHDLGTVSGGSVSTAIDISPGGYAVGNSDQGNTANAVATVFTPFGVLNLGTLGGPSAQANGIRAGLVVGSSRPDGGETPSHAFVYDLNGPGVMIDLNDRIPAAAGWLLRGAVAINAAGVIVGDGEIGGQLRRAWVLTPGSSSPTTANLLINGDFEGYTPPRLGPPGWISDDFRQVPAKSETNQPRSGEKNGACWTTDNLDCGMFQDIRAPKTGTYTFTIYANADRPGALVGANVNGDTVAFGDVAVRGFANYGDAYVLTFSATEGQTIRVWMYSPAVPGYLVIDDAVLTGPTS